MCVLDVQATAGGIVLVDAPLIAKIHAAMGALDAAVIALMVAAEVVTVVALAHRRRIPWINQRLRTRETW